MHILNFYSFKDKHTNFADTATLLKSDWQDELPQPREHRPWSKSLGSQ